MGQLESGDAEWLEIYTERLSAHGRSVRNDARLSDPQVTVKRRSPVCGSTITLDLNRDGDIITEIGFAVRACALGQAGTSILASVLPGRSVSEAIQIRDAVQSMLTSPEASLPGGIWQDLELLLPARDLRSRHGSVMLPFDAVVEAIERSDKAIEGRPDQPDQSG